MAQEGKQDPVAKLAKEKEEKAVEEELKTFDIDSLSPEDFQPLQERVTRGPHPFDGYPWQMLTVGHRPDGKPIKWARHHIVAVNPKVIIHQDPSGQKVSITTGKGAKQREKIVDLKTFHNRVVRDYENGGINTKIVFDHTITLKDGREMKNVAYVPSDSCRAQLLFKLDSRAERILVDDRYVLLDAGQANKLRQTFEMIVNPKIANERLSREITGED